MYSATRVSMRFPAGGDAEGHQAGGQHHEQHGNAVHAHVIGDAAAQPVMLLDQLEAGIGGIERRPHHQRQDEGDDGGDERDPARAARRSAAARMAAAPSSGTKVTRESSGRLTARLPSIDEPGGQRHHAQQHRQGIVIDIAGLQPHRAARWHPAPGRRCRPGPARRSPCRRRSSTGSGPASEGRAHEEEVVQFVEIPFVVEEQVQHAPCGRRASCGRSGCRM